MSRVLLCGANGQVSRLLIPLISSNYSITAVIRDASQAPGLSALHTTPHVMSLDTATSSDYAQLVANHDIIVWSAGAGGKGGPEMTRAIDRDSAIRLISQAAGKRFIMVSALTSRDPTRPASWWDKEDQDKFRDVYEKLQGYHECKVAADEALMKSDAKWTIIRPGTLTNDTGTGMIKAGKISLKESLITRQDVASVVAEVMDNDRTIGLNIDVLQGSNPIAQEIARVAMEKETSYELKS